ncbi:MAG: bifunctional YncE family protein/alkaline phosphatase family protein [Acidobacteriaceae bacterium]
MLRISALLVVIACLGATPSSSAQAPVRTAIPQPARQSFEQREHQIPRVSAVLPNGREIHPAGNWIPVAPYPFAIALSPDGTEAAVPSIGFPFALNIITHPGSPSAVVRRLPKEESNDPAMEVHAGLAYSRDDSLLWVATGDSGKVRAYRTDSWRTGPKETTQKLIAPVAAEIPLDGLTGGKEYRDSFAATLVITADGRTLYALDQGNWRVVVIDLVSRRRIASIATGNYPFGLALSVDGKRLYVANTGLFEYTLLPNVAAAAKARSGATAGATNEMFSEGQRLSAGLKFPPFGYPSEAARKGTVAEGKVVPGLGDENSVRGSSLWTYDVSNPSDPLTVAKLRLGSRISELPNQTVGGAAPTGVVADASGVYVSLAHGDAVVKVSADGRRVLSQTPLTPFTGERFEDAMHRPLRGIMPSGVAVSGGRLYVAESGIDAVAVLRTSDMSVIEHIPVGWNPSAVALSRDGSMLYVVNTKGKGAGPNGGIAHNPSAPTYVGSLEYGSVSAIPLASLPAPELLTNTVIAANTAAIDARDPLPHLKHCFLIIRENRTYDEVLGDVPGSNGDPSLARYGVDGWAKEDPRALHLSVTPNLHALVSQFAMSDNYFTDSDVSADGHRWVVGIDPTPFFNTAWSSNYGGRRHSNVLSSAPGRRAMFGGADAPMPEDEPQFGSLWEHIVYSGKRLFNYGEGLEVEGDDEMDGAAPEGQRLFLNAPLPKPVFEASDRHFPTFNLGIPDQFRASEFERNFRQKLANNNVPALIVIRLPNDHTMSPRPADGYPYRASYVADNDLALGRIIAFLSKTSIWKDSAVFVTEDDAQGGVDHVDAHRSILLVASPWVKPGAISHDHTSMGSITRTIDELLGLGPLNLEDALAGEIDGVFDSQPHMSPYVVRPSDLRVFNPAKARFARPKTKKEAAELRDMDDANAIRIEMKKAAPHLHRPATME